MTKNEKQIAIGQLNADAFSKLPIVGVGAALLMAIALPIFGQEGIPLWPKVTVVLVAIVGGGAAIVDHLLYRRRLAALESLKVDD